MKAPELPTKIYFTILDMGSGYVYTPSLDDNGGTEYIRKDAVLELLQNRNKEIRGAAHCAFRSQELQEIYWRIKEL